MFDAMEITRRLPHRYPFLMVDSVESVEPGLRAVGVKNITGDNHYAQGVTRGLSPEVMVLEAMAQVGALAAGNEEGGEARQGLLAALSGVTFHRRPAVGDRLVIELEFEAKMGPLVRFKGHARIGEEVAAEATLTFSVG